MSVFDPRVLGAVPAGLRRERIESSAQWRGGRFQNTERTDLVSPKRVKESFSLIGEFFLGGKRRRPPGDIPIVSPREAWTRAADTRLRATWLGHSTVLLEMDGLRILTDPVWGERVSPFAWAGPRRFHEAPVAIEELPPLDAVLVSHDHYDHLCYTTVRALAKRDVPFVTSLGVGAHLEAWGVSPSRIIELDWWETKRLPEAGLAFTATPSRHFSGRGNGANRTLWSSWVIETEKHKVFFSGDTGLTSELETIGDRHGPFDLVMLEVGAFHPSWGAIHLGPENALVAHRMLRGRTLLPVHWGTFDLALHPWEEPAEILTTKAGSAHVVTPRPGLAIEPSRVERIDPWWRSLRHDPASAPLDRAEIPA